MIFRNLLCSSIAVVLLFAYAAGQAEEPWLPIRDVRKASRELAIGDPMPDVPLRKSDGSEVYLRDFRGRAVAITFFYSRCTAAALCPMAARNFDIVQRLLAKMDAATRCHLLSISLDPGHDTPEALSAYASGYQADPELWTFASCREEELRRLGNGVGLEFKRTGDVIDHNLRTVVVDAKGRLRRIFYGDTWTPQELAAELNAVARRFP